MTNKSKDDRYKQIVEHYGRNHQLWKLVEEIGELIAEIGRFKTKDRTNTADLIHECADVLVLIRQLFPESEVEDPSAQDTTNGIVMNSISICRDIVDGGIRKEGVYEWDSYLAGRLERNVVSLAKHLDELPMLYNAIDMKLDRQIERMKLENRKKAED